MFRPIKEMKTMLEGAPDLPEQVQQVGSQAMAQAVRQARADGTRTGYAEATYAQAGYAQAGHAQAGYAQAGGEDEPIAGVSLEQYAAIAKYAAAFGHDPAKMAEFAETRGISEAAWQTAVAGWNARLRADAAVARRFNLRYRES